MVAGDTLLPGQAALQHNIFTLISDLIAIKKSIVCIDSCYECHNSKEGSSMKSVITVKDWYWDESTKNVVSENEKGDKYKGKAHNAVKGKVNEEK